MERYAAVLRGVMPTNCKMPALARSFEAAGFTEVRTVLGSGNVVFSARASSEEALARKAEAAMKKHLGRVFMTIVRPVDYLKALLEKDPYASFRLPANAKRVVTFLPKPSRAKLDLPLEIDGARILEATAREVFSAYVPNPRKGRSS